MRLSPAHALVVVILALSTPARSDDNNTDAVEPSASPGGGSLKVGKYGGTGKIAEVAPTSNGLSHEQILTVVRSHATAIQQCFEKELEKNPALRGKVMLAWRVELDGKVSSAKVASSTVKNANVEGCMVRQLKSWEFPKPDGTVAKIRFPFLFKNGPKILQ